MPQHSLFWRRDYSPADQANPTAGTRQIKSGLGRKGNVKRSLLKKMFHGPRAKRTPSEGIPGTEALEPEKQVSYEKSQ